MQNELSGPPCFIVHLNKFCGGCWEEPWSFEYSGWFWNSLRKVSFNFERSSILLHEIFAARLFRYFVVRIFRDT